MRYSRGYLLGVFLGIGILIGRSWQVETNRRYAEIHQSAMSIKRFMELNPYFSNKGVSLEIPLSGPSALFDWRNLSYRLFINPFEKNEDGSPDPTKNTGEEWIDVAVDTNIGFEDWTPIRKLQWNGKSLIITKDFSQWELENPAEPQKWNLRLIKKGN